MGASLSCNDELVEEQPRGSTSIHRGEVRSAQEFGSGDGSLRQMLRLRPVELPVWVWRIVSELQGTSNPSIQNPDPNNIVQMISRRLTANFLAERLKHPSWRHHGPDIELLGALRLHAHIGRQKDSQPAATICQSDAKRKVRALKALEYYFSASSRKRTQVLQQHVWRHSLPQAPENIQILFIGLQVVNYIAESLR